MMNISCTICTDVLEPDENLHATRCGHVFHNHCLSDWNMRSNTCPQCRSTVMYGDTRRIYPTFSDERGRELASLQCRLTHTIQEVSRLEADCDDKENRLKTVTESLKRNEESLQIYVSELDKRNLAVAELTMELERVKIQDVAMQRLKHENESMAKSMRALEGESLSVLKTKLEYIELKQEKKRLENDNKSLRMDINLLNGELKRQNLLYNELMAQVVLQKESLDKQNKEIVWLKEENKHLKKSKQTFNGATQRRNISNENDTRAVKVSSECQNNSPEIKQDTQQPEQNNGVSMKSEPKLSCPQESQTEILESPVEINSKNQKCVLEKFNALSLKLKSANVSQSNLRQSLLKLIVMWLRLKQSRNEESSSLETQNSTSNTLCENNIIGRLIKLLLIGDKPDLNIHETSLDLDISTRSPTINEMVRKDNKQNKRNIKIDVLDKASGVANTAGPSNLFNKEESFANSAGPSDLLNEEEKISNPTLNNTPGPDIAQSIIPNSLENPSKDFNTNNTTIQYNKYRNASIEQRGFGDVGDTFVCRAKGRSPRAIARNDQTTDKQVSFPTMALQTPIGEPVPKWASSVARPPTARPQRRARRRLTQPLQVEAL